MVWFLKYLMIIFLGGILTLGASLSPAMADSVSAQSIADQNSQAAASAAASVQADLKPIMQITANAYKYCWTCNFVSSYVGGGVLYAQTVFNLSSKPLSSIVSYIFATWIMIQVSKSFLGMQGFSQTTFAVIQKGISYAIVIFFLGAGSNANYWKLFVVGPLGEVTSLSNTLLGVGGLQVSCPNGSTSTNTSDITTSTQCLTFTTETVLKYGVLTGNLITEIAITGSAPGGGKRSQPSSSTSASQSESWMAWTGNAALAVLNAPSTAIDHIVGGVGSVLKFVWSPIATTSTVVSSYVVPAVVEYSGRLVVAFLGMIITTLFVVSIVYFTFYLIDIFTRIVFLSIFAGFFIAAYLLDGTRGIARSAFNNLLASFVSITSLSASLGLMSNVLINIPNMVIQGAGQTATTGTAPDWGQFAELIHGDPWGTLGPASIGFWSLLLSSGGLIVITKSMSNMIGGIMGGSANGPIASMGSRMVKNMAVAAAGAGVTAAAGGVIGATHTGKAATAMLNKGRAKANDFVSSGQKNSGGGGGGDGAGKRNPFLKEVATASKNINKAVGAVNNASNFEEQ